jgi:hypothetical protein
VTGSVTARDVGDATRLLALGMRARQLPSRDLVYTDLVRRYLEDPAFADTVNAAADGLGLVVLGVSMQAGAVLAAGEDSPFEMKMDEYAKRAAFRERWDVEKVLHGLAHLACAALAFPRPDDLANDAYVGRVSVEGVDTVVREACRVLDEKARAAEENNDPLDDAPELERTWRAYARRSEGAMTKTGQPAPDTTRAMIGKALRFLVDQGFLHQAGADGGGTYRTTPRYQVQVRELAADRAFEELLALGVVAAAPAGGSLRTLRDPDTL